MVWVVLLTCVDVTVHVSLVGQPHDSATHSMSSRTSSLTNLLGCQYNFFLKMVLIIKSMFSTQNCREHASSSPLRNKAFKRNLYLHYDVCTHTHH